MKTYEVEYLSREKRMDVAKVHRKKFDTLETAQRFLCNQFKVSGTGERRIMCGLLCEKETVQGAIRMRIHKRIGEGEWEASPWISSQSETLTVTAEKVARTAHEGQYRNDGIEPYANHPRRVAGRFQHPTYQAVAWLHDVVEDTDMTLKDLRERGFSEEIVEAVDAITHKEDQDYLGYILEVRRNLIAKSVKMADIHDNMTDGISKDKRDKYNMALFVLDC